MRKRITPTLSIFQPREQAWLNLETAASAELTSEDAAFPIESALLWRKEGGWRAAEPGLQTIRLVVWCSQKRLAAGIEVFLKSFDQGFCCVKLSDDVRPTQFVSDVVVPDALAVGRVEEGNPKTSVVEGTVRDALGVPFGLSENAHWAESRLLGLDNPDDLPVHAEGIIRRAIGGLKLLNGVGNRFSLLACQVKTEQCSNPLLSAWGR